MSDLYGERLEEIHGMTHTLSVDAERLLTQLDDSSTLTNLTVEQAGLRRHYVRAVFALIEAIVEQHKRLLLDLEKQKKVTLGPGIAEALTEKSYIVTDNGTVTSRKQYIQLKSKLKVVYKTASKAFGQDLAVQFNNNTGWDQFGSAIKIRDRITHPKTRADCQIENEDLHTVKAAEQWFKQVNTEFVRVAREHRNQNGW
jgi:hypothetical protein